METMHMMGPEFRSLSNKIRRFFDMISGEDERDKRTTYTQRMIMGMLMHSPDNSVLQKDIEERFNIRRSTATGILQLMEKNGMIRRVPVTYDGRLKRIVPTEESMELHKKMMFYGEQLEQQMRAGIPDDEYEAFWNTLQKIKTNLDVCISEAEAERSSQSVAAQADTPFKTDNDTEVRIDIESEEMEEK